MIGERLWTPFSDVLEEQHPDRPRVRARLNAVPAACAAALEVPGVDDRLGTARTPQIDTSCAIVSFEELVTVVS
ncbi:hypothetical protein [Streptomyces sp. 7N604]|uniref:hypothetical protein n=1 Tax=Streptomyces sp. 7N604 TaxID=3457415 RepID=UPI003FD34145